MDEWKTNDLGASSSNHHQNSMPDTRQKAEVEVKDPIVARKVQKADREKMRRDRLNEQFLELGNTLDPDRPKNDKATILSDTVQMLRDLTSEVNRLKAEFATLSEESSELTQEKNELREEKASLKSDIENLNVQYQQRLRVMFPWAPVDPSVVMGPPYSYPIPIPVPPGPIPMHPSLQPFPFFGNQNPSAIPSPCSTFIPYPTSSNPATESPSVQYASTSHISSKQDSKSKSVDHQRGNNAERCDDSDDVATDLELKMPGSSAQQVSLEAYNNSFANAERIRDGKMTERFMQDLSTGERKGKQTQKKERNAANGSSSSRYSSLQGLHDCSSNSMGDVSKSNK